MIIDQKTLRQSVHDLHEQAEKTNLAQSLISGTITAYTYKNMCWQFFLITDYIEKITTLPPFLERRIAFAQDVAECTGEGIILCESTKEYIKYLENNHEKLKGHLYSLYLGWLYGGQLIAKKLSLPSNHLKFENVKLCVDHVRSTILANLTEDDVFEAQKSFEFIIKIYNELS